MSSAECVRCCRDGFCLDAWRYFDVKCIDRGCRDVFHRIRTLLGCRERKTLSKQPSLSPLPCPIFGCFLTFKKSLEHPPSKTQNRITGLMKKLFPLFYSTERHFPRSRSLLSFFHVNKLYEKRETVKEKSRKKLEGNFLSLPCHKKKKKRKD